MVFLKMQIENIIEAVLKIETATGKQIECLEFCEGTDFVVKQIKFFYLDDQKKDERIQGFRSQ
jgi:hypothetical protein